MKHVGGDRHCGRSEGSGAGIVAAHTVVGVCSDQIQHSLAEVVGVRTSPRSARTQAKTKGMTPGDNPCYVATSLDLPSPELPCCARGQDESFIKMMKNDLVCDRAT